MRVLSVVSGRPISEESDLRVHFIGNADMDADGSPFAYAPDDSGLDALANARDGSTWCGIYAPRNVPVIQGPTDPAPGYYVSTTALRIPGFALSDPRCYINAETVPGIVVPGQILRAVRGRVLGCKARVTDLRSGKGVWCVVFDVGPRSKDGEMSIAAGDCLGLDADPRNGGVDQAHFLYELWPGVPATVLGVTYALQAA